MVLNRDVKRLILENKGQYAGLLFIVMLAAMCFVSFALLGYNFEAICADFSQRTIQEDLSFPVFSPVPGVPVIEQRFNLKMEETVSFDFDIGAKTLRVFAANSKVDIPAVLEGAALSDGSILIDPAFAKANSYKIGDTLRIASRDYRICGLVALPSYTYITRNPGDFLNDPTTFGLGVITRSDFRSYHQSDATVYAVRFLDKGKDIFSQGADLKAYLRAQHVSIDYSNWTYAQNNLRTNTPPLKGKSVSVISIILPVLLLIGSAMIVGFVLGRMIINQSNIIGTLYAMGYRKKELAKHYLVFPGVIAALGGLGGTLIGAGLFKPFLAFYIAYFPMPVTSASYLPWVLLIGLFLPGLFLLPYGYMVINGVLRRSPVSLMRSEARMRKPSLLEQRVHLGHMNFARKFSVREQLRGLPRLGLLLFSVVFMTIILNFGFIIKYSFDSIISADVPNTFDYRYEYLYKEPVNWPVPQGAEGISASYMQVKRDMSLLVEVLGVRPNSAFVKLYDLKGNQIKTDAADGFVIPRMMADKLGLSVGDTIALVDTTFTDKEYSFKITGIMNASIGYKAFLPQDYFNSTFGWTKGSYIAILSNQDQLRVSQESFLRIKPIERVFSDYRKSVDDTLAALYGLMAAALLITLVMIYVIASLTVDENRDNISLMKVFGYRRAEIKSLVLNSSRLPVILGYLIGVPITVLVAAGLYRKLIDSMKVALEIRVNYGYFLMGFVLVYLTFEASKLLCLRKIDRIPMSDALKSQKE
jgi:putative ABC transport system permease protein